MQWTKVGKSSWSNRPSAGWCGVKDHFYQHSGNHWRLQARAPCFQHIYYYSNVITKLIESACVNNILFSLPVHWPIFPSLLVPNCAWGSRISWKRCSKKHASSALSGNAVHGAVLVGMHSLHASCMCYWYGLCLCHCACMCEIHPFGSGERMQSSNILST